MEQEEKRQIAVRVQHIQKKFKLYYDRPMTLKESFLRGGKGDFREFYALNDVSFDIYKGSTVGLIGQNGCGKSTMLKIINRTMFPNEGSVEINGKVSSLIELGAGFHPDLSGRENIYTNATIFGLTREEIERRIPNIIAFSELENFIDNPVRTYSSGMYARLAFSVAIHVNADILLVDEILGVGDMNFQAKCANRIYEMRKSGMTIVMVTHDMGMIDRLCDYAVWLDHGKLLDKGNPKRLQQEYLEFMSNEKEARDKIESQYRAAQKNAQVGVKAAEPVQRDAETAPKKAPDHAEARITVDHLGDHFGNGDVIFTDVKMLNDRGTDKRSFHVGEKVRLIASYKCQVPPEQIHANIGFEVNATRGIYIYGTNTVLESVQNVQLQPEGTIEISLDPLLLVEGDYTIGLAVVDAVTQLDYDFYHNIAQFRVYSVVHDVGLVRLQHSFVLDGKQLGLEKENQ